MKLLQQLRQMNFKHITIALLAGFLLAWFGKPIPSNESLQINQHNSAMTVSSDIKADSSLGAKSAGQITIRKTDAQGNSTEVVMLDAQDIQMQESVMAELLTQSVENSLALRQEKETPRTPAALFGNVRYDHLGNRFTGYDIGLQYGMVSGAVTLDRDGSYRGFTAGIVFPLSFIK